MRFESTIKEIHEVEDTQYFLEKLKITVQFLCLLLMFKQLELKVLMSMNNFYLLMDLTLKYTQSGKIILMLKHEDHQH